MPLTQHGSHLYQLTILRSMNCQFVVEEDGLTLVDALIKGREDQIIAAAAEIGAPIRRVVLTHTHVDHVGALEALVSKLPAVELYCSAQSAEFMRGNLSLLPGQADAKLRGDYVQVNVMPTKTLQDGDMLGSLLTVAAPGHTPGHVAYFDTRDSSLIAGDAFQTKGGVAVCGTFKLFFPLPAFATWHRPTALASAKKLLALQPARMAVGHGKVLENPTRAMRDAIAVAQRKVGVSNADVSGA